jgi:hypothetical protein
MFVICNGQGHGIQQDILNTFDTASVSGRPEPYAPNDNNWAAGGSSRCDRDPGHCSVRLELDWRVLPNARTAIKQAGNGVRTTDKARTGEIAFTGPYPRHEIAELSDAALLHATITFG